MDFTEIAIIDIDGEAAEAVSDLFNRYGYGGAVIESHAPHFDKVTVRTVIPAEDDYSLRQIEALLALIGQALPHGLPAPRLQFVGESDWADSWRENFHTVRVGQHFVIKPSWRNYSPGPNDIVIEIDPGLAFGSGLHPTTQLCLKLFEDMSLQGQSLFDVGTGSGILAMAAIKRGATPVRAVDVDEVAIRVARENFERNGLYPLPRPDPSRQADQATKPLRYQRPARSSPSERGQHPPIHSESAYPRSMGAGAQVETAIGSAAETGGRQWQIVVANILAHILIDIMPDLAAALAPGGRLILSGMIAEQEEAVTTAVMAHKLHVIERRMEEDWVALVVSQEV